MNKPTISNSENGNKILTIQELSEYLKVPLSTLYGLTQKGKIPAIKVGKHWRYLEKDILSLWPERSFQ